MEDPFMDSRVSLSRKHKSIRNLLRAMSTSTMYVFEIMSAVIFCNNLLL